MEEFSKKKIFLFQCSKCDKKIYLFISKCPKCSSTLETPLETISCNLQKAPQPRSLLVKCTYGEFKDYTTEKLLHIGVSTSQGNVVVNFDEHGIHADKTGWNYSINVPIPEPNEKEKLSNSEWNLILQDFANKFEKGPKYHTLNHNCYTFVIGFLNEMKFLGSSDHSKDQIVQIFIEKPFLDFEKFFFLYKEIEKNGFAIQE